MRPHRRQPTRLPRPWASPSKNTGVGCHFPLQSMKVKSESEVTQSRPTPSDPMDRSPAGSSVHGIFQARVLGWGAITISTFWENHREYHCVSIFHIRHKMRIVLYTAFFVFLYLLVASLVTQLLKNLSAMWKTWVQSLGWKDPLEKGKAIHSSILAWRIPWTV